MNQTENKKNKKSFWIWAVVIVVIAACMLGLWTSKQNEKNTGSADTSDVVVEDESMVGEEEKDKTFYLEIIHKDGSEKNYEFTTDIENLGEFLISEELISGTESQYGLYVTTVDGETADYDADGSWWCIQVNGKDSEVGVSSISIEDGDTYTWIYQE